MSNPLAGVLKEKSKYTYGDNGAIELRTSGNSILDSFVNLLKDTDVSKIRYSVQTMINDLKYYSDEEKGQKIHDIFILSFHKRGTSKIYNSEQIADGEGLKNVFYEYILELYNFYPKTIIELIKERAIYRYGYWKDALLIWKKINAKEMDITEKFQKYDPLIKAFRESILTQREEDLDQVYSSFPANNIKNMNENQFKQLVSDTPGINIQISYVGKYCVRENSSFDKTAYWYMMNEYGLVKMPHVEYMIRYSLTGRNGTDEVSEFPIHKSVPFGARKIWRKDNVKLNVLLNVPENFFCAKNWAQIDIKNVPSVCLKSNTKALLNEKLKEASDSFTEETGNRYPENEDRIICRQNMIEFFTRNKNVNCSQLFPHQIIGDINNHLKISSHEKIINMKIWDSLVSYTHNRVSDYLKENTKNCNNSLSTGNILCCADVSGSMMYPGQSPNRPIDISVALTAFMSQLANDNFKDIVMTFTDVPTIYNLNKNGLSMTMYDRIKTIMSHVGYSTNYIGIHKCLIDLCIERKIHENDLPCLVIFTDGHFDSMMGINTNNTSHSSIVKLWVNAGYRKIPQIVYWNLASNKNSVQTNSSFPNVQLLSGYSVSNIKYVMYGEIAEEKTQTVVINGESVEIKTKNITPEQTMRKAFDEPYFDCVRNILRMSDENELKHFN